MRALVTGAAGFIGSHLSERLVADGAAVVGVDSFTDYYDPERKRRHIADLLEDQGFTLIEGSLAELDLASLLDGVDAVYHLAGQPGVRVSWGESFDVYLRENVLATQRLLEACKETMPDRFVFASSSSIYGEADRFPTTEQATPRPMSPYGVSKLAAEHLCLLYESSFGVPATALRYFSVYGPRQRPDMALARFIEAAIEERPLPVFGDGRQSRDFTYVGDVVEATVLAGARGAPGAVYNVAGGSRVTVLEMIAAMERALGKRISLDHQPPSPGDPRQTGGDTTAARRDLGFTPAMPFEDGVVAQVEAHLALAGAGAR
jgi:nucleoside-diphosphate-sugar epimerase